MWKFSTSKGRFYAKNRENATRVGFSTGGENRENASFPKNRENSRGYEGSELAGVVGVMGVTLLGCLKGRFSTLPQCSISTLVFCSYHNILFTKKEGRIVRK